MQTSLAGQGLIEDYSAEDKEETAGRLMDIHKGDEAGQLAPREDAEQGDIFVLTLPVGLYYSTDAKELTKLLNELHSDFRWVAVLSGTTIDRIKTDIR